MTDQQRKSELAWIRRKRCNLAHDIDVASRAGRSEEALGLTDRAYALWRKQVEHERMLAE